MRASVACSRFYKHDFARNPSAPMKFSVYLPPQAKTGKVPVLYYLAGLTCTDETFPIKAHAQAIAAELGLMLVAPRIPARANRAFRAMRTQWDFGQGAGFYVDATQSFLWSTNYRMYSYITRELPEIVRGQPAGVERIDRYLRSFHGGSRRALTIALRNPGAVQVRVGVCADLQRPCIAPGARRHSATIWVPTRKNGASTMPANSWARQGISHPRADRSGNR